MPAIEISHTDLQKLAGKKIPVEKLSEVLSNAKCEFESIDGDTIYLSTQFDRPDTLSTEGIARVLRGTFGVETGLKEYKVKTPWVELHIDGSVKSVRPIIKCAVIKNFALNDVSIKQLMQLQEKLHMSYGRRRAKASIGVYDFDKTKPPYTYTALAPHDISFIPLEEHRKMTAKEILEKTKKGSEYAHLLTKFDKYPILMDSRHKILSMPPILNSEDTKVDEKTKNLFLDVTGTDERVVNEVFTTIIALLAERGAEICSLDLMPGHEKTVKLHYEKIGVDSDFINKIVGTELKPAEIKGLLEKQRFDCTVSGKKLEVTIPCYRFDILHPADIAEEVAIAYGVNLMKPQVPEIMSVGSIHPLERFSKKAREIVIGLGYQELFTYILSSRETFGKKYGPGEIVEIANPTSQEYCVLRNSIIPKHLEFLSANTHVECPQKVFELDDVVIGEKNIRKLCIMSCHHQASFTEMKSVAEAFFHAFGKEIFIDKTKNENFIDGRAGTVMLNGEKIGIIGEIHPQVLNNFGLENPVACFEIDLEVLHSVL